LKNSFDRKKWKFTVSKDSYRGITVRIKQLPKDAILDEFIKFDSNKNEHVFLEDQYVYDATWTMKKEIVKKLQDVCNLYNYDNSDIMTDYFDKNYSLNISLRGKDGTYESLAKII
jgi:hypothetical protein